MNANKCTEFIGVDFVKFIHQFDPKRALTIDFKKQDIKPNKREEFKNNITQALMSKDNTGSFIRRSLLMINL